MDSRLKTAGMTMNVSIFFKRLNSYEKFRNSTSANERLFLMRRRAVSLWILSAALLFSCNPFATKNFAEAPANWQPATSALTHAHAHNDYEHEHPLYDALSHGFASVEVDIYHAGTELYVGHEPKELQKERTLKFLYLEPLRQIIEKNGGKVYANLSPLVLLIDIKTDADNTYKALRRVLAKYEAMLTTFELDVEKSGPVLVIVSGRRPRLLMQAEKKRYAAYDGRLEDLRAPAGSEFIPLISDDWSKNFSWRGEGEMPAEEKEKLKEITNAAHQRGQRIRFWATPDEATPGREAVWRELLANGVDLIGTDDLAALQKFLSSP
jgi:hypothetical protein